jgi:hypothetical protein
MSDYSVIVSEDNINRVEVLTEDNIRVSLNSNDNAVLIEVSETGPPGPPGPPGQSGAAASVATEVAVTPASTFASTNVQSALEEISTLFFQSLNAPTGTPVSEGDVWYDMTTSILKVRKQGAWEPIQLQADIANANLNCGYF